VSERDRLIIKRLKDAFEESSNSMRRLTQEDIARFMGVKSSTFSDGLKKEEDYITQPMLGRLIRESRGSNNPQFQRLAPFALDIFLEEECKLLAIPKKEICNAYMSNDSISFKLASSAIIVVSSHSDIAGYLLELSDSNSALRILNLIVSKDATAHNIEVIEQWAYSRDGNYSDQLYLNLYERDHEPITEMVGAFIEGEFCAYMYDEGYKLMSEIGHDLLLEEEQRLSDEQPVWSLPRSPEARFIERLRRELKDYLDDPDYDPDLSPELLEEVLDFLADKVAAYEAAEPAIKEGTPLSRLHEALASEIRDRYKDGEKYTVDEVTKVVNLVEAIYLCTLLQDL